jgi:hypothetical protein
MTPKPESESPAYKASEKFGGKVAVVTGGASGHPESNQDFSQPVPTHHTLPVRRFM